MRSLIIVLMLALIGLQYKLWLGDGSLFEWRQLERKIVKQKKENNALIARNHIVEANIQELKNGKEALEEQARYDLGMVKQGEVYYQFVE